MSVDVVNEGTSKKLAIDFFDEAGLPVAPATLTYRIDCVTSGTVIRVDTSVTPAASAIINITPADTRVVSAANRSERRRVTVVAGFGAGDALTSEYEYHVKNLAFYAVL